ncbi:MAG: VOC family protein [Candidatus Caldarchaeum sp.]
MESLVQGLHHITLVASNYHVNYRFYTEVLGLRQVKLSVNQDDIYHRHAFYANPDKPTGSAITFFEWTDAPYGYPGLGSPHHLAYRVKSVETLARWFGWLRGNGVKTIGPRVYGGRVSIYFRDPDNTLLELTAVDEGLDMEYVEEVFRDSDMVGAVDAEMRIMWFDHCTPLAIDAGVLQRFLEKFLQLREMKVVKDVDGRVWLTVKNDDDVFLRYVVDSSAEYGYVGRGSIHHIALSVMSEEEQKTIQRRLNMAHVRNSGIVDRFWFRSLYFRDPFGNLMEVATVGPGYDVDEPRETLGSRLVLPPWLEPVRNEVERRIAEQDARKSSSWPPVYSEAPEPPEPP